MSSPPLDKETYRTIIEEYFRAFETKDFSKVGFSSGIQFLSPISGTTFDGRDAVIRFVSGVATRVAKVNILFTAVDFPIAAGVWQMTTTKGVTYTLHNHFRLDGEGLVYIWPMFDPKAIIDQDAPAGRGLLQWLRGTGYYEIAATTPKQLAGVTMSKTGRLFVNIPRWVDTPDPSVAEIGPDGSLLPYPNSDINRWDGQPGDSARTHFVCVQSVVASDDDLWVLDPAAPMFGDLVSDGPKLLRVSLTTNTVTRTYAFDRAAAPNRSYLNDVRVAAGHAFITDSGLGAIVVVNLATGQARRLLDQHASTKAETGVEPNIGGRPWKFGDGTTPQVNSDGIAIDPQHEYLYYKALTARTLYRVPIAALLNESLSADALGDHVERVAEPGPTDGLEFDENGNLYLTALEENAIRVLTRAGDSRLLAAAGDFSWPDTITIGGQGELLFSATQFHLMPAFNGGVDKRTPPYNVFRLKLD
jgi:sugar lactone lactonase YvrE